MVDTAIREALVEKLDRLPPQLQRRVLEFAETLVAAKPKGVRGSTLLRFAGCLDAASAREMEQAVEDGCEHVDLNEW